MSITFCHSSLPSRFWIFLMRLLAPQVQGEVGHIAWPDIAKGGAHIAELLRVLADKGIQHIVPDAIAQADLTAISEAVQDFKLITGGSSLALDLPRLLAAKGSIAATNADMRRLRSSRKKKQVAPR